MILMGVDPASRMTGYCFIRYDSQQYKALEYGCITIDTKETVPRRLEIVYNELDTLIKKYKPEEMSIEDIFYGKNVKTVLLLAQMRAVMLLVAQKNKVNVVEYAPNAVKKSVTGNGKADKTQVQYMVKKILGISEEAKIQMDASDALAVALTHGLKIAY